MESAMTIAANATMMEILNRPKKPSKNKTVKRITADIEHITADIEPRVNDLRERLKDTEKRCKAYKPTWEKFEDIKRDTEEVNRLKQQIDELIESSCPNYYKYIDEIVSEYNKDTKQRTKEMQEHITALSELLYTQYDESIACDHALNLLKHKLKSNNHSVDGISFTTNKSFLLEEAKKLTGFSKKINKL